MRNDVMVPALLPQKAKIADGRFRAEKNDEVRIARDWRSGGYEFEVDRRFEAQRIGVVEVRHARQHRRGHANRPPPFGT